MGVISSVLRDHLWVVLREPPSANWGVLSKLSVNERFHISFDLKLRINFIDSVY